ncbi:MAG: carbohydrate kinase family protein [Candidatus Goldiibacteriota bacterium]|jgi:sugar/nucleoside kinase (ribokinase family)
MTDVYCYGLVELSSIYTLSGSFPKADGYKEVESFISLPGGEATNAAVVLSRLGLNTKIAGTWLGDDVYQPVVEYFKKEGINTASLEKKKNYSGPRDLVFVSNDGRSVFGWFGKLWSTGIKWSKPKESDIKNCRIACIDPFMPHGSETAAKLCIRHNKQYITLDEKPENYVVKNSTAAVISKEFIHREYPGADIASLFSKYQESCGGLVIFTFGSKPVMYGRRGEKSKTFYPYKIKAVDTLGAGDTFRAGIAYGLLDKMADDKVIEFASALAAMVCATGPGVTKSPSLAQVKKFISSGR